MKEVTDLVVVESFTAVWWLAEEEDIANAVAVMGASVSEKQAKSSLSSCRKTAVCGSSRTEISPANGWQRTRSIRAVGQA